MKNKIVKRSITLLLVIILFFGSNSPIFSLFTDAAGGKILTHTQAKVLAMANSPEYQKLNTKLSLKQVEYVEAVKTIQLKQKNMSTFRWTPLLSFKFPQKADLAESYEFVFKPLQIQYEMTGIRHDMRDIYFEVYEKTLNMYVDVYTLQETISFNEMKLDNLKEELAQNKARLLVGSASQADIDTMEETIKAVETSLAADMRTFEQKKTKLSDIINLNITSGYTFQSPYVSSDVTRSDLEELVQYTLENDHQLYEARLATAAARVTVNTNYSLMQSQYGGKMDYISTFVNQALNGEKIDGATFKTQYDAFIKEIDEPWNGNIRILFIKIPKEWFKGAISGVRYVEDDPYILYTAVLEYQQVLADQKSIEKELETSVRDNYETFITTKNAYETLVSNVEKAKEDMEQASIQNLLGAEVTYDEVKEKRDTYEELQQDMMDALAVYSQTLFSYERLTCGDLSQYIEYENADLLSGTAGVSYVDKETAEGAYYYIQSRVEANEFSMGVHFPDDYPVTVTHFELWCDGTQIGERTPIGKTLTHLMITTSDAKKTFLRFYNGDEFVDDCEIDTSTYYSAIEVVSNYVPISEKTPKTVGSYAMENNSVTGMAEISFTMNQEEGISYYAVKSADGTYLISEEPIIVSQPFRYFAFISADLTNLQIELYDSDKKLLETGFFSTNEMKIQVNP